MVGPLASSSTPCWPERTTTQFNGLLYVCVHVATTTFLDSRLHLLHTLITIHGRGMAKLLLEPADLGQPLTLVTHTCSRQLNLCSKESRGAACCKALACAAILSARLRKGRVVHKNLSCHQCRSGGESLDAMNQQLTAGAHLALPSLPGWMNSTPNVHLSWSLLCLQRISQPNALYSPRVPLTAETFAAFVLCCPMLALQCAITSDKIA